MRSPGAKWLGIFCLSLAIAGCDKISALKPTKASQAPAAVSYQAKGPLVAKVNSMPVSLEDLNQEVEAYNAVVSSDKPEAKITTRDQKVAYLRNEMVRNALLYQEALKRGLDKSPEVVKALEKTKQQLLVMDLIRQEANNVDVSSKEIEDYYNTYKDELKEPEQREIREIVVSTEQEAKDILVQLLQGADFATLAAERSKSATAKNGGDLGFIQRGTGNSQFDNVAFSDTLEVGKISNIFKGPDGYYILKLEAKRGGKQKSLSELWDDIKRGLTFLKQQKKIDDLIAKLSREQKIEIFEGDIK